MEISTTSGARGRWTSGSTQAEAKNTNAAASSRCLGKTPPQGVAGEGKRRNRLCPDVAVGIQSALRAPSPAVPLDKAWPGWLIAKDIVFVPVGTGAGAGNGILVLDGFGGVHEGGALTLNPITPKTPYFGFDIARAIAYRNVPPRANFAISNTVNTEVTSGSNVVVASTTLTLPDDGFVLILGNLSMGNNSLVSGATAQARICVGVDGTGCLGSIDRAVDMEPAVDATSFHGEAVTQGAFLSSGAYLQPARAEIHRDRPGDLLRPDDHRGLRRPGRDRHQRGGRGFERRPDGTAGRSLSQISPPAASEGRRR